MAEYISVLMLFSSSFLTPGIIFIGCFPCRMSAGHAVCTPNESHVTSGDVLPSAPSTCAEVPAAPCSDLRRRVEVGPSQGGTASFCQGARRPLPHPPAVSLPPLLRVRQMPAGLPSCQRPSRRVSRVGARGRGPPKGGAGGGEKSRRELKMTV